MTNSYLYMLIALIGVVIGAAGAYLASFRSAAQPLEIHTPSELAVVGSVLAEPRLYSKLVALRPSDFSVTDCAELWERIESLAQPSADEAVIAEARKHRLAAMELPMDAHELAVALSSVELTDITFEELTEAAVEDPIPAGEKVLAGGLDRLWGRGRIEPHPEATFEQPLMRRPTVVTRTRLAASALAGGATMAVGGWGVGLNIYGVVAVALLTLGLLSLSLVDIDTLYIDMPVFWLTLAAGSVAAALYARNIGELGAVWKGAAGTAIGIIVMQITARLYLRLRKRVGLGGGDVFLMAITLGVTYALSGDYRVPLWGLIVGAVCALAVKTVSMVKGRSTREDPHPFGPYLASGWVIAWALLLVVG